MKKKRVLLAMSGGIDSSVAAILLQEQGFEVIGITMLAFDYSSVDCNKKYTVCCSFDSLNDVRKFSDKLGFAHHTMDIRKNFETLIINNFVEEYLAGRTPNPCVLCNSLVRWPFLLEKAREFNCDYVSTGHYARINKLKDRYIIKKGRDKQKDQSYFLWGLSQDMLKKTIFPLEEFTKTEVRKTALSKGFPGLSEKSESMEVCFIPDNDYRGFLRNNVTDLEKNVSGGDFISTEGKIIGRHKGYPFYTIGQRKGLEIAVGHPLYVTEIRPETNTVILGSKDELNRKKMSVENFNPVKYGTMPEELEVTTRIRYNTAGVPSLIKEKNGKIQVTFKDPVSAVTPGQSAVFYEGEDLVGGGFISG